MSNWICENCGATYIDVSHQEPSVLEQELEIRKFKELLKECRYLLKEYDNYFSWDDGVKSCHLIESIDNAIGEKKC